MRQTNSEQTKILPSELANVPPVTPFIPVQLSVLICARGKSHFAGGLHE